MKKILSIIIALVFCKGVHAETQHITVILDWMLNPNHATLFIAQDQGYFKEENLHVDIISPADADSPPKWVASGKGDIALTYQPQFILAVAEGLTMTRIGTLIATPLNSLVVLEDSPVKTIADLKGKRIASSHHGIGSLTLKTLLTSAHMNPLDVKSIHVHYDLLQALLTHNVDAITSVSRNIELIEMKHLNRPGRAFHVEEYGMPSYDEFIFIVPNTKRQDPRWPRFLRALEKATAYLQRHPEESWVRFALAHPELNNSAMHEAWLVTVPYFAPKPSLLNKARWNQFNAFILHERLVDRLPPLEQYAIELNTDKTLDAP